MQYMKKNAASLGVTLVLALAFSLIFYICNTPIGACIGSDNAMYLTMGTALAQGYAPYTEIFDHKGPLLFILQWLPQALAGGYSLSAVFWQQAIFLFVCLLILRAMAREVRAPEIPVQLAYLALIAPHVAGGNLTEEYAAVFTLAGLLAALRVFSRDVPKDGRGLMLPAAVLGAAATAAFMTRANNALPLCALAGVMTLCLLAGRKFAAVRRCALGCLTGVLIVGGPIVVWLTGEGALGEAIYASITHNMMYAQTGGGSRLQILLTSGYGWAAMLMLGLSLAGGAVLFFARGRRALGLSVAGCALGGFMAAFISHKFYNHYLIVGAPCAAMGAALIMCELRGRNRRNAVAGACAVCAVCLIVSGVSVNKTRAMGYDELDTFAADARELYAMVPEDERDSFMAYRVEPRWYVCAKALPCMRFYFLQEILADADPAVMDEIVAEFESDPPAWVVIYYNREFGPPYDARVAEIFETQYEFVDARGQYQLLAYTGGEGE